MPNTMSLEQQIADLTAATTNLLDAVNVRKSALDAAEDNAAAAALAASQSAAEAQAAAASGTVGSLAPEAGKAPLAGEDGKIASEWVRDVVTAVTGPGGGNRIPGRFDPLVTRPRYPAGYTAMPLRAPAVPIGTTMIDTSSVPGATRALAVDADVKFNGKPTTRLTISGTPTGAYAQVETATATYTLPQSAQGIRERTVLCAATAEGGGEYNGGHCVSRERHTRGLRGMGVSKGRRHHRRVEYFSAPNGSRSQSGNWGRCVAGLNEPSARQVTGRRSR